jgi:hypothetical protein
MLGLGCFSLGSAGAGGGSVFESQDLANLVKVVASTGLRCQYLYFCTATQFTT